MPFVRHFFLIALAGFRVSEGLCSVANFRFLGVGQGILTFKKLPQGTLHRSISEVLMHRRQITHEDIGIMLNGVDLVAVFVIAGACRLHIADLNFQIRFPFRIGQLRRVQVHIFGKIRGSGNHIQPCRANVGKGREHGSNQENQQEQQPNDPPGDRVALDRLDHTLGDLLRRDGGILDTLTGFLRFPCRLGILPLELFLLPEPGKPVLFQLRVLLQELLIGYLCLRCRSLAL